MFGSGTKSVNFEGVEFVVLLLVFFGVYKGGKEMK